MKFFITTLFIGLMALSVFAQTEEYEPAHEGWHVQLDEAYQESVKTGKPIMAYFTGSDWCPPCRRFSAAVITKPEFSQWAKDKVVLLELDNPKRKQVPQEIRDQNNNLRQAFKVTGVPTIWVFNLKQNGQSGEMEIEPLGRTGFTATVADFTASVDQMLE